ncbi:hypothetical protein [Streptosporangium saharense]|uniref:hypothetical protein n=1 Tax=Streptosporangium saharense TaxID=1706840 RepID=UPI00332FD890
MTAEQWTKIEELSYFGLVDMEYLMSVAEGLVGLFRRAKEYDQLLYCWTCV